MAGLFNKLNGANAGRVLKEGIDTSNFPFKAIKEYIGKSVPVDGFFFSDSKYGKQVVIVSEGVLINMPKRAVEQFEELKSDPELVAAVLQGKLVLTDIKMIDSKNGTTTAYTLTEA